MNLQASWEANADTALRCWRIYLSTNQSEKGRLVAEVNPEERSYLIRDLGEGDYWVTVIAVSLAGTEEGFLATQAHGNRVITRTDSLSTPATLTSAGSGVSDGSSVAAVVFDPPASTGSRQTVEVIRGSSTPSLGQLVGTTPVVDRSSYTEEMGERGPMNLPAPILPGRRAGGGDCTLAIRARTVDGKHPGPATSVTVPFLDHPNHHPVVIASVTGATLTGISAPTGTDAWETDATDGIRLREVPTTTLATADWGDASSGLLADHPTTAQYLLSATVEADQYDLGAAYQFMLECYDEAQRKSLAGYVTSLQGRYCKFPTFPAGAPGIMEDETQNIAWASRLVAGSGEFCRPLRLTKWEVRWSATTATLSGVTYVPYVPAMRLRARYVQVRFTLAEPVGLHQVICPRLYVRAWVPHDTRIAEKTGATFTTAQLQDVTVDGGPKEIGIRSDAPYRGIQANVGGTVYDLSADQSPHPNGINDKTLFAVSYTAATRVFVLTTSTGARYWSRGQQYYPTVTTTTMAAHADTTGVYWLYFSGATLATGTPDFLTDAPLAYVFFATDGADRAVLFDERHPATWDPAVWRHEHQTVGAKLISGGTISDYTVDSNTTADTQFSIAETVIEDESYRHTLSALADAGPYTVWYRTGAASANSWNWSTTPTVPYLDDGDDPYYNQISGATWANTAISTNNKWVNYWLCATNAYDDSGAHYKHRFILIMGQAVHANVAAAREESFLGSITWGTLPFAEIVPLYKLTYRRVSDPSYKNVQIDEVARIAGTSVNSITTAVPTAHSALSGRSDLDQHPHYSISLDAAPAVSVWDGCTSVVQVDSNATGFGALLVLAADGNLDEAAATGATWAPATAMALESGTGLKRVLWWGTVSKAGWSWNSGPGTAGVMYLSATTGAMRQTAPTTSALVVQRVGFALATSTIFFRPSLEWSVVA